jgi:hypothetical protein
MEGKNFGQCSPVTVDSAPCYYWYDPPVTACRVHSAVLRDLCLDDGIACW